MPCFHAAKHAVQHCRGGRPVSRPRESERNVAASVRLSIDLAEAQPRRRGAANVGKRRHKRQKVREDFCRSIQQQNELEHAFDCCSTRSSTRAFYVAQHSMARPWTISRAVAVDILASAVDTSPASFSKPEQHPNTHSGPAHPAAASKQDVSDQVTRRRCIENDGDGTT